MQTEYTNLLALFAIHFSPQLWPLVQVLLTGAILTRGQRTVTAILRVMGLSGEKHFVNYHRVLQRAHWSSHAVSQTLLRLLVSNFVPTGVALKYYYFGKQRVAMRTSAGVIYLHSDHLGSTNTTSGVSVSSQTYYAYGSIRSTTGTVPTDFGFTGQRRDASAGLMYYNARYYDSTLGRFVSADTIVPSPLNPQSLNRFSYTLNNPVRYIDPSGHMEQDPTEGTGGGNGEDGDTPLENQEEVVTTENADEYYAPAETGENQNPNGKECWPNCWKEEWATNLNRTALVLDVVGALVDTGASVVALSATGLGTLVYPAGGEAPGLGAGEIMAQPFLRASAVIAWTSTAATAGADLLEGESVINPYNSGRLEPLNGEYKIGPDTANSFINSVIGTVDPEVFTNTAVAYHQVLGNDLHILPTSTQIATWIVARWPSDARWPDLP